MAEDVLTSSGFVQLPKLNGAGARLVIQRDSRAGADGSKQDAHHGGYHRIASFSAMPMFWPTALLSPILYLIWCSIEVNLEEEDARMADVLLSDRTISATDVKKRGIASFQTDNGSPVAVMKNNRPQYYVVEAGLYAEMMEALEAAEDAELLRLAEARRHQPRMRVSLDDL
jgi:PHD/YefM family antitoxin component YafN of YafNO toxin-antitoxin module